ncbi:MAG TPA: TusE/DsrC/DsvC family sulfur relay protein [Acidimicrobiales bacterium]|nr:MAG: sulfur relay protein DsrC [Actinobacteria bacterium 21-73-9]HQU25623.1 TusE/DsrC/DsvC family sulfur relay protein [Acidimicrobiales bacterium]
MTTQTLAGVPVERDAEGFLTDPSLWSEAVAVAIAAEEGITLTERHWEVVRFMRHAYETTGAGPNVRLLAKASGVSVRELYALFPRGPAKTAAKIAGIPKPHGCI